MKRILLAGAFFVAVLASCGEPKETTQTTTDSTSTNAAPTTTDTSMMAKPDTATKPDTTTKP